MPIRRMKQSDVPLQLNRRRHPAMADSSEWKQLRKLLEEGALRPGEALEVDLSDESRKLCKNPLIAFRLNFLKQHPPKQYRYTMFTRNGKLYVLAAKLRGLG